MVQLHEKTDFEAVYDTYYDRVYKYAYMLLLNREDAEDVTADAFLAAYANYSRYDPRKASITTWLTRIVHNRAVNLLRSADSRRRGELPESWEAPGGEDPAARVEAADTVLRLCARLKPEERELLQMRCVMEMKDGEIGAVLGLSGNTVNRRYRRLLVKCRSLLTDAAEAP